MMHIPSLKEVTKEKGIESLPDAPFIHISLQVKEGKSPDIQVKEGDYVFQYQLLVKADVAVRVPVYSPVSGIVTKITGAIPGKDDLPHTVYIINDFREETVPPFSPVSLTSDKEVLINRIEEAGILGHGGAEFPTALKYKTQGKEVKTFIMNGAECEPYLTADYSLMKLRTKELIEGIRIIASILEPKEVIIAVEKHNKNVLSLFERLDLKRESFPIRLETIPNEYPQGGELQLIRSVTGKELKKGTIPLEAGIVVNNVGTIYAIRQTFFTNRPVISRVVTVSGEHSEKCGNYEVKLGTPFSHILDYTGYKTEDTIRILQGGPMMGKTVLDLSAPVTQGTNGILVLPEVFIQRSFCIGCGYCVDVCPMFLMPFKYDHLYRQEDWKGMKQYNLGDCISCASCEYICPCEVPLMKSITEGKKQLKRRENEIHTT